MKDCTGQHTPNFFILVQPRKVFVLELIQGTVPSYFCLFLGVVVADQHDEHHHIDYRQPKGHCADCETGEEDTEERRGPLGQELVWSW
jgi:hypothetical protein